MMGYRLGGTANPGPPSPSPLSSQPGRGHGHLAQGDAAVVGRRQTMGQDFEAQVLQPFFQSCQHQGVLKNSPGQGRQIEAGALPESFTG